MTGPVPRAVLLRHQLRGPRKHAQGRSTDVRHTGLDRRSVPGVVSFVVNEIGAAFAPTNRPHGTRRVSSMRTAQCNASSTRAQAAIAALVKDHDELLDCMMGLVDILALREAGELSDGAADRMRPVVGSRIIRSIDVRDAVIALGPIPARRRPGEHR